MRAIGPIGQIKTARGFSEASAEKGGANETGRANWVGGGAGVGLGRDLVGRQGDLQAWWKRERFGRRGGGQRHWRAQPNEYFRAARSEWGDGSGSNGDAAQYARSAGESARRWRYQLSNHRRRARNESTASADGVLFVHRHEQRQPVEHCLQDLRRRQVHAEDYGRERPQVFKAESGHGAQDSGG